MDVTNSETKLIFHIIEGRSWPTRENLGTNLMVHSLINSLMANFVKGG